ncbi:hypothetical protein P154DRAFT_523790 [Amniculicola lignicola CBS 123094]|uniref:Ser/Thr protein phosphatase superfamily n=1 Tax=Amniculicola lignicola CBS 123094 TaxID=1392246 RepID=A0A6A5WF22_9PLEO|nr:hypothetical protein P154DRAFT_523790 [Amniculicola lignicola CBS 123094]
MIPLPRNMRRLSGLFNTKTPFQILSDLHLNHESQYLTFHIPPTAPYLILAGNIGCLADYNAYLSFLIRRCNLYERVYLVLGSLEYSGLTIPQGLHLASTMEREARLKGKLTVLHQKRVDVPGTTVTILGCTLWSNIPKPAESAVLKKIPEFDKTQGIKNWSVSAHNEAHRADLAWLRQQVQTMVSFTESALAPSVTTYLVVTSYAPDTKDTLRAWQIDSPWSTAYGTDILQGPIWGDVKVWVYGATGRTGKFKKEGIKFVSNQRGCVGEEEKGVLQDGMSEKAKVGLFDVTKAIKV